VSNDILLGKTAYVNGKKITGGIQNRGTINSTINGINQKIVTLPQGYIEGGVV
jgi:hypothetical protein